MKNFMTVFNFEFKQFFAKKSTRVIMVIYFVLMFGLTFIPTIANSSLFKSNNNDNFSKSAYVVKDVPVEVTDLKEAKKYESKEQIEKDIKDGKLEDGIVLLRIVMNIYQNKVLWVTMIVRLEMPLKQMLKN